MGSITVSAGTLNTCGKLKRKIIRHTERTSRAVGATKNGIFGGGMKSNSTTTSETILTLSLIKVGNDVYSDLNVPLESMFEILKVGDEIAVIVSSDGSLLAVKNHTQDIQVYVPHHNLSYRTSFITYCYLLGGSLIAILGISLLFSGHSIIAWPIILGGAWTVINGNRLDNIEIERSKREWTTTLAAIGIY
jgi:hypothetical protein